MKAVTKALGTEAAMAGNFLPISSRPAAASPINGAAIARSIELSAIASSP